MIAYPSPGGCPGTFVRPSRVDSTRGTARATPSLPGSSLPRNRPVRTVPCVIRVINGVGVAVFPGQEHLLEDVYREAGAA